MIKTDYDHIIDQLTDPVYRWNGLVDLKNLDVANFQDILVFVQHPFWLVSWAFLDKIQDFKNEEAIPFLFPFIMHPDPQIRQKVKDVISNLVSDDLTFFITKLDNPDYRIRHFAITLLIHQGFKAVKQLSDAVGNYSWVISDRLIQIIWDIIGPKKTKLLAQFLSVQSVQRHTIILMALSKNETCIEPIIKLYKYARLRQHIILSMTIFGLDIAIPSLINLLATPSCRLMAKEILKRLGSPAIPYLLTATPIEHDNAADILEILKTIKFSDEDYDLLTRQKKLYKHLAPFEQFKPKR